MTLTFTSRIDPNIKNRTFVQNAAKVGYEPMLTDTARCTSVGFRVTSQVTYQLQSKEESRCNTQISCAR